MHRLALAAIAALALTGCTASPAVDDGRVRVVASTNVYGSLVEAIGGDHVAVTSLIDGPARDPHSFEASARDQLAISKAELVVENGGGYDDFVDTLLDAASSDAVVVTAFETAGLAEGANEHLWYDPRAMALVAAAVADELAAIDPGHAGDYRAALDTLADELDGLADEARGLGSGRSVAITEPVPLYLLELAGFENVTPGDFSEAIEEGTDVAPTVLRDALERVADADLLAYNSQTASPETEQLRAAAEQHGVPVVEFTETLPEGDDYISWMRANIAVLQ